MEISARGGQQAGPHQGDLERGSEEALHDRLPRLHRQRRQGEWTGRKEIAPEGGKVVTGDHKMANGLRFDDYNALRRQIAEAIVELTR